MTLYLLQGISVLEGELCCVVLLFWPALFHLSKKHKLKTHTYAYMHTHTRAHTHAHKQRCSHKHSQECAQWNSRTVINWFCASFDREQWAHLCGATKLPQVTSHQTVYWMKHLVVWTEFFLLLLKMHSNSPLKCYNNLWKESECLSVISL